jgi:hypothetical protein
MASRSRRLAVAVVLGAVLSGAALFATNADAGAQRAGVVVNHDTGADSTACVRIPGDSIRAIDLLSRTSFAMYTEGHPDFGRSMCWLDGEGFEPGESCFDATPDAPNWGVWLRKPGQSQPKQAQVGLSSLAVPANGVLHVQFAPFGGAPDFSQPTPDKVGIKAICEG